MEKETYEKMKKETYEKPTIKTEKIELGAFGDYGSVPHSPNIHGKGPPLVFLCSR
jgi:hypothetical protein